MAKCDEGYICEICNADVETIAESDLYLRYVIGFVDPETLHTKPERHIRCNPELAQFIGDENFAPAVVEGAFDKRNLDEAYVQHRTALVTRGWQRLQKLRTLSHELTITEYPLPEIQEKWAQKFRNSPS